MEIFLGTTASTTIPWGAVRSSWTSPDGPNPFIDTEVWGKYLDEKRDALLEFMKDPKNN